MAGHLTLWTSAGEQSSDAVAAAIAWAGAGILWISAILMLIVASTLPDYRGSALGALAFSVGCLGFAWVGLFYSGAP